MHQKKCLRRVFFWCWAQITWCTGVRRGTMFMCTKHVHNICISVTECLKSKQTYIILINDPQARKGIFIGLKNYACCVWRQNISNSGNGLVCVILTVSTVHSCFPTGIWKKQHTYVDKPSAFDSEHSAIKHNCLLCLPFFKWHANDTRLPYSKPIQ